MQNTKDKTQGFAAANSLFAQYQTKTSKGYVSQEFQDFAYRLAVELDDLSHKSLYMRLAKYTDRLILEKALSFVSDAQARNKAKLFMWKVKQLKEQNQHVK